LRHTRDLDRPPSVVRVGVHAADPISLAGISGSLRTQHGLTVRSGMDSTEVDVLVVACGRLTEEVNATLRVLAGKVGRPVVLVCGACGESELQSAVECGVVAVVPRSAVSSELLREYVLKAAAGGEGLPPTAAAEMIDTGWDDGELSLREIGVLRLVSEGYDTKEIAGEMHYSERTVKNVLYGITQRLNLRNRSHAVAYALRAGLI
jgi:DNA-binding NarL/FixJ family response regulator